MPKSLKAITLANFVHGAIGEKVVIDLKDESTIEGILDSSDLSLNIHLVNATFYRRRFQTKPEKLSDVRIKGFHIRFIHFENYGRVLRILTRSYRKKTMLCQKHQTLQMPSVFAKFLNTFLRDFEK